MVHDSSIHESDVCSSLASFVILGGDRSKES